MRAVRIASAVPLATSARARLLLLLLPVACQAVVLSCGGKLTVALYTIRPVARGEELTFDYSCVTESEEEFKQALCMCSTRACRGSYLHYTGSNSYMQVRAGARACLHAVMCCVLLSLLVLESKCNARRR